MKKINLNINKGRHKVSNILLRNYLKVFLIITIITIALLIISLVVGGFLYIKRDSLENESAEIVLGDIENEDYNSINENYITKNNGWIEIIDDNLNVIKVLGTPKINKERYSTEEFGEILVNEINGNNEDEDYVLSIGYSKKGHFFVLTRIPKDEFVDMFVKNPRIRVKVFVYSVGIIYIIIFLISLIIYSKLTSRTFTKPLEKLMNGVRKLTSGDYSTRINIEKQNEFKELGDAFNNMASKIEKETKLKENSEKLRKEFVRNIAHDLKTPLSSIVGYSNILKQSRDLDDKTFNKYINIIESNGERANEMIMELFEFYTLQSSEFMLSKKRQDLSEFLRNVIADYIYLLEEKEFDFDFEICDEAVFLEFDEKKLERAIGNLIINSVKYNKEGTEFLVSLYIKDNIARITVSDNGIGLSDDIKKNMFNPFVRGEKSRNSKKGGSGLGLTITKQIVDKHDGRIYLDDAPLSGCNFIIELPIT